MTHAYVCGGVTADTPSYPFVIEGCDRDGAEIDNTTLLAMWRSSMPIPGIAFAPTPPLTCPLKRVHLKDQIMDKLKGGRNAKKRS
jgi:hypothetical protein